jgi:competence protein ComEC
LLENVNVLKLPHHGQIDSIDEHFMENMPLAYVVTTASSDRRYHSAHAKVYERLTAMRPEGQAPQYLFTDERQYPPYFSQPDGFQAITLVIKSGTIVPEFIKTK